MLLFTTSKIWKDFGRSTNHTVKTQKMFFQFISLGMKPNKRAISPPVPLTISTILSMGPPFPQKLKDFFSFSYLVELAEKRIGLSRIVLYLFKASVHDPYFVPGKLCLLAQVFQCNCRMFEYSGSPDLEEAFFDGRVRRRRHVSFFKFALSTVTTINQILI